MTHVEFFEDSNIVVQKVNNYEPYIYRVLFKDGKTSDWEKPKHSFVQIDGNKWSSGINDYTYEQVLGIQFRVHAQGGRKEYIFKAIN